MDTIDIKESIGLPGMMNNITLGDMMVLLDDMKASVSAEITLKINASEKTQSESVKMTTTFSGENIGITWLFIKPALVEYIPDAVFDDKNHSITLPEQSVTDQPITDEEEAELLSLGLQINQYGNKIRIPAGTILEEFSGEIPPGIIPDEIILIKQ